MTVPAEARLECTAAPLPAPPRPGEKEYQVFGARQTERLQACEKRRALAVQAMDEFNRLAAELTKGLRP